MLVGSRVALVTSSCYGNGSDDDVNDADYTAVTSAAAAGSSRIGGGGSGGSDPYETFGSCDFTPASRRDAAAAVGEGGGVAAESEADQLNGYNGKLLMWTNRNA